MPERLRALLEQPLAPGVARAVVYLAAVVFIGFAAVAILGAFEPPGHAGRESGQSRSEPLAPANLERPRRAGAGEERRFRQDPQDRAGIPAAVRASRTLQTHSALQDIPFRKGDLSIELVGADHGRAVLLVSSSTVAAARGGWRSFLRDHHDSGDAYEPRFQGREARGSRRAGRNG